MMRATAVNLVGMLFAFSLASCTIIGGNDPELVVRGSITQPLEMTVAPFDPIPYWDKRLVLKIESPKEMAGQLLAVSVLSGWGGKAKTHGYDVVLHFCAKGKVYYRGYSTKRLSQLPLGGLIDEFRRRSDDDAVIKKLKAIQADRNFFAHKGYLLRDDEKDEEIRILSIRAEKAAKAAKECIRAVAIAACKISGEPVPTIIDELA